MKKQKKMQFVYVVQYTMLDEMMASPSEPIHPDKSVHQLFQMRQAFDNLLHAPEPTTTDWRVVSDAVNMLETFITRKTWLDCDGDPVDIEDKSGLLQDAITALAMAGQRHRNGGHIRLDAAGINAVRAILDDYASLVETMPARAVIACHRATEKRIHAIQRGYRKSHDVSVMAM